MSTDAPKNMFAGELQASFAEGAALMASMVRTSVFDGMQLPPQEIFSWYALNVAYVFVEAEHRVLYADGSKEAADEAEQELKAVLLVCEKTKQLVLLDRINHILRTRTLHLPGSV